MNTVSILFVCSLVTLGQTDAREAFASEYGGTIAKSVELLKKVTDEPSTRLAVVQLKDCEHRLADIRNSVAIRTIKKEDIERLLKRKELVELQRELKLQCHRLMKCAYAEVLFDYEPLKGIYHTEIAMCETQITMIEQSCALYKVVYGKYPGRLEQLLVKQPDGSSPMLISEDLRDPWGNEILYDVAGPKNKNSKPDIWSSAHIYKKHKEMIISNWQPSSDR